MSLQKMSYALKLLDFILPGRKNDTFFNRHRGWRQVISAVRYALQGSLVFVLITINTTVLTLLICLVSIFKFATPKGRARNAITHFLSSLGELWVSFNRFLVSFYREMEWDVEIPPEIHSNGRYLVFCNHQSGVDILALQHCLNRKAPFGRYLLKHQLIWVPVLGVAWWALDMAFLRRYSQQELIKNPSLRGKDLENAARACEKLKNIPVSMMTFPEGTRFSEQKHRSQDSTYRYLLRPKYGGVGQVLYSFDDALDALIDVTICYPDGIPTVWQYISGQVSKISLFVRLRPIPETLLGRNFRKDPHGKAELKEWLGNIWQEKDQHMANKLA
jgi:1-acyl-sn-glycerol-3-phosphate acyltransferase